MLTFVEHQIQRFHARLECKGDLLPNRCAGLRKHALKRRNLFLTPSRCSLSRLESSLGLPHFLVGTVDTIEKVIRQRLNLFQLRLLGCPQLDDAGFRFSQCRCEVSCPHAGLIGLLLKRVRLLQVCLNLRFQLLNAFSLLVHDVLQIGQGLPPALRQLLGDLLVHHEMQKFFLLGSHLRSVLFALGGSCLPLLMQPPLGTLPLFILLIDLDAQPIH